MITVYGMRSPFVYRVRAALIQKELAFEHVDVNLANRSEEFRKLSMVGKIPVLQDGETTVWDSKCIVEYLDQQYPESYQMMGRTVDEKVLIDKVALLVNQISDIALPLIFEKMGVTEQFKNSSQSYRAVVYDDKAKEDAHAMLKKKWEQLQVLLGDKPFFTGQFSFADAAVLATLQSRLRMEQDVGEWKAYYDACMSDEKIALMFTPADVVGVRSI